MRYSGFQCDTCGKRVESKGNDLSGLECTAALGLRPKGWLTVSVLESGGVIYVDACERCPVTLPPRHGLPRKERPKETWHTDPSSHTCYDGNGRRACAAPCPIVGHDPAPGAPRSEVTKADAACCVGQCCGPGSYCCQNAGPHDHESEKGGD